MQHTKTYNSVEFGKKVKAERIKFSNSLDKFIMEKGGLSTATWSRIENGKNDFKLSTIIAAAALLNTTASELLKDIDFDYNVLE